jgi:hypothetical protein
MIFNGYIILKIYGQTIICLYTSMLKMVDREILEIVLS